MISKSDYTFAKGNSAILTQFDSEIVDFIIDNGLFVEDKDGYWIYYLE